MTQATSQLHRKAVASYMQRLYNKGLTTTSGGNVSCRLDGGLMAISASKLDKGNLRADQVCIIAANGRNMTPHLAASIETELHLAIYAARPDVRAIVHAHPVTASAFCATRTPIDTHLTAEAYAILGDPAWIPYALMGTPQLAKQVADGMAEAVCGLMENHGVITVGKTLLEAFDRLELLEVAAKHTLLVRQIGTPSPLTPERLDELDVFVGRKKENANG